VISAMCLIGVAVEQHPDFPLIIIANRDENLKRPSVPPKPGDTLLMTHDAKSHGTCIGLNSKTGDFVALTNMGKGGEPGYSRGALAREMIENVTSGFQKLYSSEKYCKFNLIWGNIFTVHPKLSVTANKPDGKQDFPTKVLTKGIHGIGNDLYGDEFVKVPHLTVRIEQVLQSCLCTGDDSQVHLLRDKLGEILLEKQASPWLPWISKLFYFSKVRRVQPATQTLLTTTCVLLFLFSVLLGFNLTCFFTSFFIALSCACYHHAKMNHIFVQLDLFPIIQWGTMSQTVVILTKTGKVFYFYRDTVTKKKSYGVWMTGEWISDIIKVPVMIKDGAQ